MIESAAIEYLQCARHYPVGMADGDFVSPLVNNASLDAKSSHPVCRHKAGWAGSYNQPGGISWSAFQINSSEEKVSIAYTSVSDSGYFVIAMTSL